MTSIVFDYADIRSRMLGEDRPRPWRETVNGPLPPDDAFKRSPPAAMRDDPRLVISPKAVDRMSVERVDRAEAWQKFKEMVSQPELFGIDPARPLSDRTIYQRFTKDQWRAISAEQWRELVRGGQ